MGLGETVEEHTGRFVYLVSLCLSLTLMQMYEGHTHYIMNISINPKDANTFASACLDRTVKMWSLGSSTPNFTMDAHDKGVNYVDFYPGADKPYLVTTGDDKTVKVWDYLSKSCVQTMEGHTNNVSFAVFHPNLPIIVSGSEDGTVKIWNSGTYRLENTLSYALERAWCVSLRRDANELAVGFDEGVIIIKVCLGLFFFFASILTYLSLAATSPHLAWIPPANLSTPATNKSCLEVSRQYKTTIQWQKVLVSLSLPKKSVLRRYSPRRSFIRPTAASSLSWVMANTSPTPRLHGGTSRSEMVYRSRGHLTRIPTLFWRAGRNCACIRTLESVLERG